LVPVGIVALGCCLLIGGCRKARAPEGTTSPAGKATPAAEEKTVETVGLYMDAAHQALKRDDAEAAAVELQGALGLLQQALMKQRQAEVEQAKPLPADLLVEMAEKHGEAAQRFKAANQMDAATAHYSTVASLLQVAADREGRLIVAEGSKFNADYTKERDAIQKWFDGAQQEKGLTDDKRADLQKEYQSKLDELEKAWAPKREQLNTHLEEVRKQADKRQAELTKKRCEAYRAMAEIYKAKKEDQQAQYYETMAYQELARAAERSNDYAAAEAEYGKWLKARPDDLAARMGMARCLEQQGKQKEAAEQYRQLLKKNPKDVNSRFQLAALLGRQQKWDEALAQWKQILDMDRQGLAEIRPDDPSGEGRRQYLNSQRASHYWQLASVCQQAGKKAEAKAAYAKAAELNPQLAQSVPEEFRAK
jgi:tetratricopeptide (TPR) repeat protein